MVHFSVIMQSMWAHKGIPQILGIMKGPPCCRESWMGVKAPLPQSEALLQDQWVPVQWKLFQVKMPFQDEWVSPLLEILHPFRYGE